MSVMQQEDLQLPLHLKLLQCLIMLLLTRPRTKELFGNMAGNL
jgi:hypothetical protein